MTELQAALGIAVVPVLVPVLVVVVVVVVVVVEAAELVHREVIQDLSEETRPLPSLVRHWDSPLLHCKRALLLHSAMADSCSLSVSAAALNSARHLVVACVPAHQLFRALSYPRSWPRHAGA